MNDAVLVKLDCARLALAQCKTAMEAKQISDAAEAARIYLERTNASVETVNRATEIRIMAERQMGVFLKDMPKSKGGAAYHASKPTNFGGNRLDTFKDIGLKPSQADTAQKLAKLPEPEFYERIAVAKASNGNLSTAAVLRNGSKPLRAERFVMPTQAKFIARGVIQRLSSLDRKDKEWRAAIMLVARWCKIQLNQIPQ